MSAVEAAATLQDYMDMWTHRKISSHPTPSAGEKLDHDPVRGADRSEQANEVDGKGNRVTLGNYSTTEDGGFEYAEGEDETLPWKCAACEFIDPAKQVVVEHWQRHHCAQVTFTHTSVLC